MVIATEGTGERSVFVSYISEVPVWKSTYRIVLGGKRGDTPLGRVGDRRQHCRARLGRRAALAGSRRSAIFRRKSLSALLFPGVP